MFKLTYFKHTMNQIIENINLEQLPTRLDSINLTYKGINFHIYGILHALTGGNNQEYVQHVNDTIKESKGLKLGEKSMLKMYKGLDEEVDDWIQMPLKDVFHLTLNLVKNPFNWYKIGKTIFKEKFTKYDRFGKDGLKKIEDIGGSMAFHAIDPYVRRQLTGFPSPKEYLIQNFARRNYKTNFYAPRFPDKDWSWLTLIEPHANIPCRSIHMIETAVDIANSKNVTEVSLFIGENHNTDIHWYVNRHTPIPHDPQYPLPKYTITEWLEKNIAQVIKVSKKYSKFNKFNHSLRKFQYLGMAALAASIPVSIFFLSLTFITFIIQYIK